MFPGEFTLLWMKGTVGLNAWGKIFVFIENLNLINPKKASGTQFT